MWPFEFFKPNIAKLEKRGNVKGLIRALRYRRDPLVREKALEALGRLRDPRALEPVVKALKDEDLFVQERAIQVLGFYKDDRAYEALVHALNNQNGVLRAEAAKALGKMGRKNVLDPLTHTLKDDKDYVRRQAARALGGLGEMAIGHLIDALHGKDWKLREGVTLALGEIGDSALEPLMEAMDDANDRVRQGAAVALGKLHDKRAFDRLVFALKDDEKNVRNYAAHALFEKGWQPRTYSERTMYAEYLIQKAKWGKVRKQGKAAIRPLVEKLCNVPADSSHKASDVLMRIVGEDAYEPLIQILQNGGGLDMWSAAWAIKAVNNDKCIGLLISALGDEKSPVSRNAEEALCKLGESAVPLLIETLNDTRGEQREEAAAILGRIGDIRAVRSLALAACDTNEALRLQATEALESMGALMHT